MAFFLTVPFILALFCSSLLAQVKRFGMVYRSLMFIPYVLASVVTAAIWRNLLDPRKGIGAALADIGIEGFDIAYLGKADTALFSIAFIDNWHFWGFLMILFLAAMQAIPPVLYDAAKIDGANRWQEWRHVTMPGIRPILLFMFMMVAIWSFLAYDYIWILTQGGPAGASEVIATQLYKNAFTRFQAGYGAAQGVIVSIFCRFHHFDLRHVAPQRMGYMSAVGRISLRDTQFGRPRRKERPRLLVFNHAILILLTAFSVIPLLILASNSVKSNAEIALNPLGLPTSIIADNYVSAWEQGNFATTMGNSVIYVVATIAAELVLGGLAAYALARRKPPGSDVLMLYFLVASTVPLWMYIVPLFVQFRTLKLLNTMHGLILIYVALNAPLTIFLLRSYMIDLPGELEDAARVDGANEFQVLTRIVLPLTKPGFLTVGLVVGLGVWNEFVLALTFIHDPSRFPITTSFFKFTDRFARDWALTSAGAVIIIFPVMVLFLALQRQFIEGLAEGGIKT